MEIPSKYNPKGVEEKIYAKWLKEKGFAARAAPPKKPFCIMIPPPNVTGILHMGHALKKKLTIIFRQQHSH